MGVEFRKEGEGPGRIGDEERVDLLGDVIAKWCVIEPRLIKTLSGFEETDWAVKVIVTVEDKGFG